MTEVYIKYNPYRRKTEISINGKSPKQNSQLFDKSDIRLQDWVENLSDILTEEYNTRKFKITFYGTMLDYEDVKSALEEAKKKQIEFQLEYKPCKEVENKEKVLQEIYEEIKKSPFPRLNSPQLINSFETAINSIFQVCVIATMSAGKSTLINALLNYKLMPSKQEACTAIITEIKDNDEEKFICDVYNANNEKIKSNIELTPEVMKTLNEYSDENDNEKKVSKVCATGNIPFVTAEDTSLVLIDTPGPNNANNDEHGNTTWNMLNHTDSSLILYVLNAGQHQTTDNNEFMKKVSEEMNKGGKQAKERFIFVVNKLDDFDEEEDDIDETLENIKQKLCDFKIVDANVFPASALLALNLRRTMKGEDLGQSNNKKLSYMIDQFNEREFFHFEEKTPLNSSMKKEIIEELEKAKAQNDSYQEALIHSGIPSIEKAIQTYVRKYAKTDKIKNVTEKFSEQLKQEISMETIKKDIIEKKDEYKDLLVKIKKMRNKLKDPNKAKEFKEKIDQLDYREALEDVVDEKTSGFFMDLHSQLLGASNVKLSKSEAKKLCENYQEIIKYMRYDFQDNLAKVFKEGVERSINDILKEYKDKLYDLVEEVTFDEIIIDPYEIMQGDLEVEKDINLYIKDFTYTETVKVGEELVINENAKWYNPLSWLTFKNKYDNRSYISGKELSEDFLSELQAIVHQFSESFKEHIISEVEFIKENYKNKFDEFDKKLDEKFQELENCMKKSENIQQEINKLQKNLDWINNIQDKINALLEI